MLIIEISFKFLYVWKCMELYDKKFWSTRVICCERSIRNLVLKLKKNDSQVFLTNKANL